MKYALLICGVLVTIVAGCRQLGPQFAAANQSIRSTVTQESAPATAPDRSLPDFVATPRQETLQPPAPPSPVLFPPGIGVKEDSAESTSTPIVVRLAMSEAPKLNEVVEIALDIATYRDSPHTTAQIELPPGAQVVSGTLTWEGELTVDSAVRLMAQIAFTQVGEYSLRGLALAPLSADTVWGDDDYIFLTVLAERGFWGFAGQSDPQLDTGPQPSGTAAP